MTAQYTEWLEGACDEVNATLAPLRSFVIPGGTPGQRAAARLPHGLPPRRAARDRRRDDEGNPEVVRYLNRLSDLLFILARATNEGAEPLWDPGAHGSDSPVRSLRDARARLGGAQAGDGQRHPQRADQIAAEDVARHVPGEDQQREADARHEHRAQRGDDAGAGAWEPRAPRTA